MDFSNYDLERLGESSGGVYDIAGYTIRQIADAFNVPLGDQPNEDALRKLIHEVGRKETLQDNISHVEVVLGSDAANIAAGWLKRSGVMKALNGPFSAPTADLAPDFDVVVMMGGITNWMWRRLTRLLHVDPEGVGTVVLAAGDRPLGAGEHQIVKASITKRRAGLTEYGFCERFIAPVLREAEFDVTPVPVHGSNGDDVCRAAAKSARHALNAGTVLVVSNAPNALQAAGQFYLAARELDPHFDEGGDQLFVASDPFMIAEHGEGKEYYQNPVSGLGQLCRDALFLHLASQSIAA
jgi:hypothetical protein